MKVTRLHRFRPVPAPDGFSIVEILIGTVLLAITLSMAATLSMVSTGAMRSSEARSRGQAQIDSDVAAIRDLAETYTWCTGSGGFSCGSIPARTETYYFPTNAAAIVSFETACSNPVTGDLNGALVAAINGRAQPQGITRTVVNDTTSTAHRLRITYAGPEANRVVVVVPTVAAWCP